MTAPVAAIAAERLARRRPDRGDGDGGTGGSTGGGGTGGGISAPNSRGGRLALGILTMWLGAFCLFLAVGELRGRTWDTSKSGMGQLGDALTAFAIQNNMATAPATPPPAATPPSTSRPAAKAT